MCNGRRNGMMEMKLERIGGRVEDCKIWDDGNEDGTRKWIIDGISDWRSG